jgi:hypothetical protein
LSFLFSVCLVVLGCKSRQTDSPSKISDGPKTLEIAQAMTMFYGNFDPDRQTSTVTFSSTDSVRIHGEPMTVRPLFHMLSSDANPQSFILVTYAVPKRDEEYYCHACAPTLGMAVFTKKGSNWTLTASNRAVTDAGGFGKPPKSVELVEIGTNHRAVQIKDTDEGGETTTVLLILAPWNDTVNLALERIIGDDNEGMCDPKGLPCYSNHRTVAFSRNPNADYFDLELRLTGTDLPASNRPRKWIARNVAGLEVLKLENGKYQQVSRSGDLTTVDRVAAEREKLK